MGPVPDSGDPTTGGMPPWATTSLWLLCAVWVGLAVFATVSVYPAGNYDQGAYYYAGLLLAEGKVPYRDYFVAHPPGLTCLTAALVRCGLGLDQVRLVLLALALTTPAIVGWWVFRLAASVPSARPVAVVAVLSAPSFFIYLNLVITTQPAVALMVAAVVSYSFAPGRPACLFASILLLFAACLFRLQAAYVGPGMVIMGCVAWGWRDGLRRGTLLGLGAGLGVVAVSAVIDGITGRYLEDVVLYHLHRTPVGLAWRAELIRTTLSQPEYLLGLICAILQLWAADRRVRGVAALTLVTTGLTIYSSRSFYPQYFLPVVPLCAVCMALQFAAEARSGRWRPAMLVVLFVTALQLQAVCEPLRQHMKARQSPPPEAVSVADELARLRSDSTIRTVLADPGPALDAGKGPTASYYSADPFAAYVLGRFDEWVAEAYPRADAVILTEWFVSHLGPRGVAIIRDGPKPVFFLDSQVRKQWEALTRSGGR